MKSIRLHDKSFTPYLPYSEISAAIDRVAAQISADYADAQEPPILLCILNGAIPFTSDLMLRLPFPIELVSTKLSSYVGTNSTGNVRQLLPLTAPVRGREVIVCEDIVDTGTTIEAISAQLKEAGAARVRICTLLFKKEVYRKTLPLDYVGIEIPNRFIVGFGLDYDELGRNLKDIYVIE